MNDFKLWHLWPGLRLTPLTSSWEKGREKLFRLTHPPLIKLPTATSDTRHSCHRHFSFFFLFFFCFFFFTLCPPLLSPTSPLASLCRGEEEDLEETQTQQPRLSMYTLKLTSCYSWSRSSMPIKIYKHKTKQKGMEYTNMKYTNFKISLNFIEIYKH